MINRIQRDLNTINGLDQVSVSPIIGKLESKLPSNMNEKWIDIVIEEELTEKSTKEMFSRFMSFLNKAKEKIKYLISEARHSSTGNKAQTCFVTGQTSTVKPSPTSPQ